MTKAEMNRIDAEAFFAAVNQTLIEIRTIIRHFDSYGTPAAKTPRPTHSTSDVPEIRTGLAQAQHFHFGNVSGSQIQIDSNGSTQTQANSTDNDLEALKGLIAALGEVLDRTTSDSADELQAELATLKAQAASPKPKWAIIKATARSIRTIAEGGAGGILSELAKPHIATLFALAGQ